MLSHVTDVGHEGGADFLQELEVNVLPLVQFYAGGKRVEAFPCGPRKIELLREKLEKWQSWHNHTTAGMDGGTKIPSSYVHDPYHTGGEKVPISTELSDQRRQNKEMRSKTREQGPRTKKNEIAMKNLSFETDNYLVDVLVAKTDLDAARSIIVRVPLFTQLTEAQLDVILQEGRIAAYEAGDVLISEGDIGKNEVPI